MEINITVFPAYAGMSREVVAVISAAGGFPRLRGDEPWR